MINYLNVQLYLEDDFTKVHKAFNGITEATREIANSSFSQIKASAKNNQEYLGFRWFLLDQNDNDLYKARDIGETVEKQKRITSFIVKLDIDKTKVLDIFQTQREAAKSISQHESAITNCVKHNKLLCNFYWMQIDKVDKDMLDEYLKINKLPDPYVNPRGAKIQKLDAKTENIIKTYNSIVDACKEEKISPKIFKRASTSNEIYNNSKWRIIK